MTTDTTIMQTPQCATSITKSKISVLLLNIICNQYAITHGQFAYGLCGDITLLMIYLK
jgi:hypothetical protein